MSTKTIVILSAKGIGDALLMMVTAHQMDLSGYKVIFFHEQASHIASLFPHIEIIPYPEMKTLLEIITNSSLTILQNDHGERACTLFNERMKNNQLPLIGFFPKKSPYFMKGDFYFTPQSPILKQIARATATLLGNQSAKPENGIIISPNHIYRRSPRRVILHPTSGDEKKNWSLESFISVAKKLKKLGFEPEWMMSEKEKREFKGSSLGGFPIVTFPSLVESSTYLYESGFFIGNDSGLGHLASNIKIPTITIGSNKKWVSLWRPSWYQNTIITPCIPLPNFKGINLCLREKYWRACISPSQVIKEFMRLR